MRIILVALLAVLTFACESESKKEEAAVKEEVVAKPVEKKLNIEINFKTNKEDDFKVAVNNIIKDEFQKKSVVITERVAPSSGMETINASFGENIISNNIRFDLGNKQLKELEFGSITVTYGDKSLDMAGTQIDKYFIINKFVQYDTLAGKLKTQRVDGSHYPAIALKRSAINTLTKE